MGTVRAGQFIVIEEFMSDGENIHIAQAAASMRRDQGGLRGRKGVVGTQVEGHRQARLLFVILSHGGGAVVECQVAPPVYRQERADPFAIGIPWERGLSSLSRLRRNIAQPLKV